MTPCPTRAREILTAAERLRVLVVGDLMLDRYVDGRVERVSPEAPVPVLVVEGRRSSLGGAANVAAGVVALGAGCAVIGCVGEDDAGREVVRRLGALGIDVSGVSHGTRATSVKTRFMAGGYQLLRSDEECVGDVDWRTLDAMQQRAHSETMRSDAVVLQDYGKGTLAASLIRTAKDTALLAGGLPVVVDPKRRGFFNYGAVTVFKPNAKELADALGEPIQPSNGAWMERVRRRLGCENLLLTMGGEGMALCTPGGTQPIQALRQSVADVAGAGDTVSAVLAVALAAGADMLEAAELANLAAGLGVTKPGVATVSGADILEYLESLESLVRSEWEPTGTDG